MKKLNKIIIAAFILSQIVHCTLNIDNCKAQWVAKYNGTGNSWDFAFSIATDDSGNVYVTGESKGNDTDYDIATVKYNSNGDSLWVRRYNGPGNSVDNASSIAVDHSGNIYVTGGSYGSGTSFDYVTIKYNSQGSEQWTVRYNGPGNFNDQASSIAIDDSGFIYLTGYSFGIGTSTDYATIKYNSEGAQLWVARYNGTGNESPDQPYSITTDALGNVYVTGMSFGDYATIKYNSAGLQEWVSRYNGPGNSGDVSYSVDADGSGNVYVTGYIAISVTDYDYATIKYNSAGVQQWIVRYNGPGNSLDRASSIVTDILGNVYVTGYSTGIGSDYDYATIKYNSQGVQQWVGRYNGPENSYDQAYSIAIDDSENVYVTGGCYANFTSIKYNSAGAQQWVARNGSGGGSSIVIDGSGNVYVTGDGGGDYVTIKNPQLQSGINQTSSVIPEKFSLSQNYPNPFNPVTNLEFACPYRRGISDLGFVSLKVYDLLGKEVMTLVNEKLSPGKYEVEFDGSGLPSGVYFYRFTAGEFTDVKTMMLVK